MYIHCNTLIPSSNLFLRCKLIDHRRIHRLIELITAAGIDRICFFHANLELHGCGYPLIVPTILAKTGWAFYV